MLWADGKQHEDHVLHSEVFSQHPQLTICEVSPMQTRFSM